MGTPYATVTVSGYNSSPPSDDAAATAANQVKWSTIKSKLPDPLKTALESINTNLVEALDYSSSQKTAAYTTTAADHMQTVELSPTHSGAVTFSLGDAATMTSNYLVRIKNSSAYVLTVGRVTSGDTIDAVAGNLSLGPKQSVTVTTNSGANGYLTVGEARYAPLPGGHLYGLTLSNNAGDATNDIDIAVGEATSNDVLGLNRVLMSITTALVKQLDAAWAVGTNQGMLDTGSIANTTYHIFLIQRPDTGVVDILSSTSATSPTMPTNYTKARRIGSILREGAVIVPFIQVGDNFQRKTAASDVSDTNAGAAAVTKTLSVPTGIKVLAHLNVSLINVAAGGAYAVTDLAVTDQDPGTSPGVGQLLISAGERATSPVQVMTNTSGQVRTRLSVSDAGALSRISTVGWSDTRERI